MAAEQVDPEPQNSEEKDKPPVYSSALDKSPASARIILFASNEFLADQTIQLAASAGGTLYLNALELAENAVDWSLEDRGLLSIRSRGHFSRTLKPMAGQSQPFWEYVNYAFALIGLLLVYFMYRVFRGKAERHNMELLQGEV